MDDPQGPQVIPGEYEVVLRFGEHEARQAVRVLADPRAGWQVADRERNWEARRRAGRVQERMADAWNYWLATVTHEGNPHAAPLWGIWVEDQFYFSTGASSRKGHNLAHNPNAVVHLESGDETVILEGVVEPVAPGPLFDELDRQYYDKYDVHLTADNPVYGLAASKAFAWRERDFPTSATRWLFNQS